MRLTSYICLVPFLVILSVRCYAQSPAPGYFEVDGDSLYFEISGEGFPLVLVSGGSGMDIFQWSRVAPILAKEYRVILVDPRGVGRSGNPTREYNEVDDIERLAAYLNLDRFVIVGLSSGGGIVLRYALHYPTRLAGVVASAPFVPGFEFSEGMMARVNLFARTAQEGKEPFLESMFADAYFIPAPLDRSIRKEARENMGRNYDKSLATDPNLAVPLDPPLIQQLGAITPPVLLLAGELDYPDVHRRNDFLTRQLSDATEARVASSGHNPPLENPDGFLEAIRPFLKEVAGSPD